ncbi:hypothetical protein [Glutamicibacter sp. TV12E]|uniref:hypothetical protein n=1 Tax=Glutamicibacter sp. TV12E TaxID=3446362 RepID=UPI0040332350
MSSVESVMRSGAVAVFSIRVQEQTIVAEADGTFTVPTQAVQGLLEEASKVLAGNPVLTADRVGAGLKPIPMMANQWSARQ